MSEAVLASIRESPVTAVIGCVALVPLMLWGVSVVGWMVMGEMDFLFGTVAIFCAALLGLVVMTPGDVVYSALGLVGIVFLMIVFPIVRRQLDRRALVLIDVEQIEAAYEQIVKKPDNSSAMFRLAELLYHRGLVAQAVAIGDRALADMPQAVFPDEHRAVNKWKHAAKPSHRPIPCLECGHRNVAGEVFCGRCGGRYLAAYARGSWLGRTTAMRLIAAWVAAMVAIVGLPFTLGTVDSATFAVVLITVQLGVAGLLVWRAFKPKEAVA